MRNRDEKLLAEAYLRVLREQQPAPQPINQAGLIDINSTPEQVLAAAANISQNVLLAGLTDGSPQDEKIQIVPGSLLARDFIPTQQNIDADKSLGDQIYDLYGNLEAAIKGGRIASKEGKFPILTFNGKFIIDGHHRWSQACITNPNCKLDTANIQAPGIDSPNKAINLAHLILYALYGKSITKDVAGTNLVGLSPEIIKKMVVTGEGLKSGKPIVQSAIDKLFAAGFIKQKTAEAAGNMYAGNSQFIKQGNFPRKVMPQPLDSGAKDGLTVTPDAAAQGQINYIAPKQTDVQQAPVAQQQVRR
jgi:hypothetical protein